MSQKEVFLASECNAWLARNLANTAHHDGALDSVRRRTQQIAAGESLRVLEIGCGNGVRLQYLTSLGHQVSRIEPSAGLDKFRHGGTAWTDDPDEWVSLACLRKLPG